MPVRIHAVTRNRRTRAQAREAAHADNRQAEIVGRHSGIQSDRARIETLVFRKESFGKTVPSQARLVQLAGVDHLYVGNRNQLHPRRSVRVESRHLTAAARQRQRKGLRAVSEVITSGEQVVGIEVVIDLANQTVDVVQEVDRCGNVVIGAARSVADGSRDIRDSARDFAPAEPPSPDSGFRPTRECWPGPGQSLPDRERSSGLPALHFRAVLHN